MFFEKQLLAFLAFFLNLQGFHTFIINKNTLKDVTEVIEGCFFKQIKKSFLKEKSYFFSILIYCLLSTGIVNFKTSSKGIDVCLRR